MFGGRLLTQKHNHRLLTSWDDGKKPRANIFYMLGVHRSRSRAIRSSWTTPRLPLPRNPTAAANVPRARACATQRATGERGDGAG